MNRFISLEGVDGAGKTTQLARLLEYLRQAGERVTHVIDPGGTHVGSKLRSILLDKESKLSARTEALLFLASRAQLVVEKIRPALEAGEWVVSDRYEMSTLVYQGHAGGIPLEELRRVLGFASGGLQPGLQFVLDLPVEVSLQRRGRPADRMEDRPRSYLEAVRQGFRLEAQQTPGAVSISAEPSVEDVESAIRQALDRYRQGLLV